MQIQQIWQFIVRILTFQNMIELIHRAALDDVPNGVKQNALNRAAMASDLIGEHDKAFHYVRGAIAVDTTVAVPYTTLAETFAF